MPEPKNKAPDAKAAKVDPEVAAAAARRQAEAAELSRVLNVQTQVAHAERVRRLARKNPLIQQLLGERNRLAAENKALREQIAASAKAAK